MKNYTYSHGDKTLVYIDMKVNIYIGKFVGQFTLLNNDTHFNIVAIYQERAIKQYSQSQIRPLLEIPSILDDTIT